MVIDLAEVTADDDLGLWVVPAVAGDALRRGVRLTVVVPDRHLRARLRLLGARQIEITDSDPAHGSSWSRPGSPAADHERRDELGVPPEPGGSARPPAPPR
jgi:hypothetical protein